MSIILLGYEPGRLPDEQLRHVRSLAPDMEILVTEDRGEIEANLDRIEIAARRFPRDLLSRAPRLRWLQQWGAGADWLLKRPEVASSDLLVTSASGVHSIQITEHITGLLLAFARQLHLAIRAQARHEWWRPERDVFFELAGKTMVLVGVGAIGARTAEIASALGMRVLGVRRHGSLSVVGVESMYAPDRLLDVLPQGDFCVLTVPLTHETKGLIGERELQAMKSTSYLINIGRGGTVQELALVRALREGWIAGAGLDVFEQEPLPSDSPLWDMENVIITAHYAGLTPNYEERAMSIFVENLERYRVGRPLLNVVDKELGY